MKRVLVLSLLLAATAGCNRGGDDNAAANALAAQESDVASNMQGSAPPAAAPWQTAPNGLRYRRTRGTGEGRKPQPDSMVTLHYVGMLEDGTVFDSSFEGGAPRTMELSTLIPAWRQGVPLMSEGDVYEFEVPPELGYGAAGAPPVIPPNATLRFTIGLLRIDS